MAGAPAAHAARKASGVIPVVMTNASDPVGTGLVVPRALRQGLRDLGDVEGRTIVIEARRTSLDKLG